MPLPASLAKVTASTGPWEDAAGFPLSGHATIRPSTIVYHVASGTPIVATEVNVPLDSTGSAAVRLPATDAPGCSASNWTYLIEFHFTSRSGEYADIPPFNFQLPRSTPTVDLDTLIPVDTSPGVQVSLPGVLSVGGLTGTITVEQLEQLVGAGSGGGGGLVPGAVQASDVIADVGDFLEVDATTGDRTVQAPDDAATGDTFAVCKVDSTANTVTVDFTPSTVNGDGTALIVSQWAGATFIRNVAGAWRILSYMPGSTSTGGDGNVTVISGGGANTTYSLADIDGGNASSTYTLPGYSGGTAS